MASELFNKIFGQSMFQSISRGVYHTGISEISPVRHLFVQVLCKYTTLQPLHLTQNYIPDSVYDHKPYNSFFLGEKNL